MPRRTQQARREATIKKLLDATIECLVIHGYRDTSIGRICDRAGVSHGGLFRHFATRTALVAAAAREIAQRHMQQMGQILAAPPTGEALVDVLVRFVRHATRDELCAAWREVITAARTDEALREAVAPAVQFYEDSIIEVAAQLPGAPRDVKSFGTLVLSLIHMFDSEASTQVIVASPEIEGIREAWAIKLLQQALNGSVSPA